jgi:hypothetical protein
MLTGWRKVLHLHRDPNWVMRGANSYEECACGARRVRRRWAGCSPVADGWPALLDRHNRPVYSTGWVPVDGWPDRVGPFALRDNRAEPAWQAPEKPRRPPTHHHRSEQLAAIREDWEPGLPAVPAPHLVTDADPTQPPTDFDG